MDYVKSLCASLELKSDVGQNQELWGFSGVAFVGLAPCRSTSVKNRVLCMTGCTPVVLLCSVQCCRSFNRRKQQWARNRAASVSLLQGLTPQADSYKRPRFLSPHCRSFCLGSGSNRNRLYRRYNTLSSADRCCCCCCCSLIVPPLVAAAACCKPGGVNSTLNLPVVPNLPCSICRQQPRHITLWSTAPCESNTHNSSVPVARLTVQQHTSCSQTVP